MASKTQIRLGQITGSFGDREGGIIQTNAASSAANLAAYTATSGSFVGIMSDIASQLVRIHGGDTFAGGATSTLKDIDGHARVTYANGAGTILGRDDGTEILSVAGTGNTLGLTGSFLPEANGTRDLGGSSLHWRTLHVGQVDATGVTGSLTDTSIGANRVVFANAANALTGDANLTFDGTTLTLGTSQDLTVGRNATITGNLTVNGTTTTVNSTTVTIDDRFIFLADGAQSTNTPAGIVFSSGSNQSARPDVSFARIGNDLWALGTVSSQSGSAANSVPSNFDIGFRAQKFELKTANDNIALATSLEGTANSLEITSGESLVLDSGKHIDIDLGSSSRNLRLYSAENEFGKFNRSSNDLRISGSKGNIQLDAAQGTTKFLHMGNLGAELEIKLDKSQSILSASNANDLVLAGQTKVAFMVEKNDVASFKQDVSQVILSSSEGRQLVLESNSDKIRFKEASGNLKLDFDLNVDASTAAIDIDGYRMLQLDGGVTRHLTISGSQTELRGGAGAHKLQFFDAAESHYVELKAPAITSNVELILPAADATVSGQALISNASGQLSFASVGASAIQKGVFEIGSAGHAADTALAINSGQVAGSNAVSGLVQSDTQGSKLDVYVNGQLLQSGSSGARAADNCDYSIESGTQISFSFALEGGDVVQVIKRG